MTDKLSIFNGALQVLGSRQLVALTENRRAARELHLAWDGGIVAECLEAAQWMFAVRAARLEYEPGVEPDFGYSHAFPKTDDWRRTVGVCEDAYFNNPLTQYSDERSILYADLEQIYVRFVSDDAQYGGDFSTWPKNFCNYVHHTLAERIAKGATGMSENEQLGIQTKRKAAFDKAAATDAMNQPALFAPQGSWVSARRGGRSGQRGSRSRLIG